MLPVYHPKFTTGDVDLISANGELRFRTRASTLARASGFFAAMFADAKPDAAPKGEPAQIALGEDPGTLEVLLRIAHGEPFLSAADLEGDIDAVERVALAAEKYDIGAALEVVRLALHSPELRTTKHALRRYALAARFGWSGMAQEAATAALDVVLNYRVALPQMEMRDLERLLALRHARVAVFTAALNDADGPFAFENSRKCRRAPNHPVDAAAWTVLKQSMLLEMWKRPSGTSVLADGAAKAAFRGKMTCCTNSLNYDWESFVDRLNALLDGLPWELL